MNTREEIREMRIREWKKVFEDKAASGLSTKEYCQRNGIGKDQYFYWQKIVRESVLDEIKTNKFTELPVPVSSDMFFSLTAPSPITITVGKGTITVQDKESLKMVMEVLTGYWYEEEKDYVSDERLRSFIESGEAPAILALGAMSFESGSDKAKLDMFVNAFRKTGTRAVIQGFAKTLADYDLPDTMIACGSVPHSWLFKQGKFVIHHCGFGTSASSLIYGIPSIPIPHVLDQLSFAMQLEKLDVATKHIDAKDLSEAALVAAIEEMNRTYSAKKKNALSISGKIQTEDGIGEAVRLIETYYFNKRSSARISFVL